MGKNEVEDSHKLVTVVIAFLNEEAFLAEAVESVLSQTYTHWELLLVDDGSTDLSTEKAKEYAAQFSGKIIYLEHDGHLNRGLSASRNVGIKRAKGKLVALLDADDVWLPGKLENQVAIFNANPGIGMVAEASEYWYSWNDPQHDNRIIPVGVAPDKVYKATELLNVLYPLAYGAAPCPSGLMILRTAFERTGYFEESFRNELMLYEDQAFLIKMYLSEDVYISSACNNLYRQRTGSIVQSVKEKGYYHNVRQHFLEWLEGYCNKQGFNDRKLHKLIKQALLPYHHPFLYFVSQTPANALKLSKRAIPSSIKQKIKHQFYN